MDRYRYIYVHTRNLILTTDLFIAVVSTVIKAITHPDISDAFTIETRKLCEITLLWH